MQHKSNIAAFFDFDETLVSVNSSKIGFKWLYEHKMLTKGFILKVIITQFLNRKNIISEKRMADIMINFYKNKKLTDFEAGANEFYYDFLKPHLAPKIMERLEFHKKNGHILVIVSGSIRYYLEPAAKDLGIHHLVCTDLEEGTNGLLTGKAIGQVCIGNYKRELTLKLVDKLNIDLENSYAYGDNQADIPLLKLVGNPFAVEPTPTLKRIAQKNNWPILNYN
ncbi:MAG: HAD-IB family hydrolase [Planctomycetia bacterium]|nr:HAD-IB family hydrolase [Planctomycetia bacterium]